MNNEIKVPYAGEIYTIHVPPDDIRAEIALATFSGLFFGKFEIGPQGRPYQVWVTTKVYFRDKLISQICQIKPNYFLVAEYSKPGYWLIDKRQPDEDKNPVKIEDERAEHNSGCTDLQMLPMFEETKFPYVVSRNKFKIDLIDLVDNYIFTLCEESNTSGMTQKMSISTTRQPASGGHSI